MNNTLRQILRLAYAFVENVLEAYVLGACKTLCVNQVNQVTYIIAGVLVRASGLPAVLH